MKNVLIACEYSDIVRDAFENAGWNAWSCDLLPTESEQTKASGKHIEGDIQYVFSDCFLEDAPFYVYINEYHFPEKWDLLIAHPSCTYLSEAYTGAEKYGIERMYKRLDAYRYQMPSPNWWSDFKNDIEVIGNIHDNPELLEIKN